MSWTDDQPVVERLLGATPSVAKEKIAIAGGGGREVHDLLLQVIEHATNTRIGPLLEYHNSVVCTCEQEFAKVPVYIAAIKAPFALKHQRHLSDVVTLELEPNEIKEPLPATMRWSPPTTADPDTPRCDQVR